MSLLKSTKYNLQILYTKVLKVCELIFRARTYLAVFELPACTLDVLLHEQQVLHAGKLLRISGPRECPAEILDLQTRPPS